MPEGTPSRLETGQPDTLSALTQYIASTAFETYVSNIGEVLSPQLAGQLAVQLAELVRPSIAEAIAGNLHEVPVRLVGIGESAAILGVSKQRVHQLSQAEGFPEPIARLKATPVWAGEEILLYNVSRTNRTGRPSRRS